MRPFEYTTPKSKEQAISLLGNSWEESAVLAGGTDLLTLMKDDVVHPRRLVNVKQLPNLRAVKEEAGEMRIGALVTLGELADNPILAHRFPALHEALWEAASPQIRNMATLGGNLCQRPRCWYFRNGMGLLPKDEKGESLVLKGDNRYHAVLGNDGPAYFVNPSTISPVLIAYNAQVLVAGGSGGRVIPLSEFYRTPANESEREFALKPGEIVTDVIIPYAPGAHAGYYEVRQKEAFDWPMATCTAVLKMSGGVVQSGHVVLGQVAPIPWVSQEAIAALVGKAVTEETAMAAANAALAGAKSLGKNKYKITVAKVAVKRTLLKASGAKA